MTIELEPVDNGAPPPRRRNGVAIVGAAVLLAGAAGVGFGLGRATDDRAGDADDATRTEEAEPRATPEASSAPEDTTTAGSGSPAAAPAEAPDPASPPTFEAPVGDGEPAAAAADSFLSSEDIATWEAAGGPGWSMFGEQPLELITQRTTAAGVTVRAHRTEPYLHHEPFQTTDGTTWQPPPWCSPNAELRIALGGGEATGSPVLDVGSVSWWQEPFKGRAISWLTLGVADDNPYQVVVVQAPPGTTAVTAAWADGQTDGASPENGVALLVAAGAPPAAADGVPSAPDVELTFEGDAPAVLSPTDASTWDDPEFVDSCSPPPPALPAPGEQPADPAAAEAAVRATVAEVYDDDEPGADGALIDDETGVAEARRQVAEGDFGDAAASAVAVVEEIVFTSPTDAVFRYRLETSSGVFGDRFGAAVLIDGTWKLTRDTVCLDLGLAGGDCGGPITPAWPPVDILRPGPAVDVPAVTDPAVTDPAVTDPGG